MWAISWKDRLGKKRTEGRDLMDDSDRKNGQGVRELIRQYGACDYDPLISDAGYEAFYHLSSLRHALLSWYPFQKEASVLEISGGYGAMTGLYLERFSKVTVLEEDVGKAELLRRRFSGTCLDVIESSVEMFETQERYDFLFLIDADVLYTKPLEQVLRCVKPLLKEDGRLFLGIRNKDAFKYECGALDEYVMEPFQTQMLPDRRDVEQAAGKIFAQIQTYLPLPDFSFAQMIVTQEDLPQEGIQDRIFCFDPFESPLYRNEDEALGQALRNGTIRDRANFYLFELSDAPAARQVTHAVLSSDRDERAWATVMFRDGTVEKHALKEEGKAILRETFENLEEVKAYGLLTVPQQWEENVIVMPRVRERGLLEKIRVSAKEQDAEGICRVFDCLWKNVLKSSEETANGEAVAEQWGISAQDAGPVLKKGWIDLIPYNAFDADGEIRYFDQEFCVQRCPAKYILYRAIHYTWLHLPQLDRLIPEQEMFQRFEITKKAQDIYQEREDMFVSCNRNWALYSQVYGWAQTAREAPERHMNRLTGKVGEKKLCRIHEIQLELLKSFDAFCRQHELHYFAIHGTLLGAVRHQGFIPWDEDIDVGMLREDFDRLIQMYSNDKDGPYLQRMRSGGRIFFGGYAKLRDRHSTGIERYNLFQPGEKGIWIDIFPLDRCESDPEKRQKHQKRITRLQRCVIAKMYPFGTELMQGAPQNEIRRYYRFLRQVLPYRVYYFLLEHEFRKVKQSNCRSVLACYYGEGKNRNIYPEEELHALTEVPFEDMQIPVPEAYDTWLRDRYGTSYMQPVRKERKHTEILFDTEHPYWELGSDIE